MKTRLVNIFWGIVLIGLGIIFFLRETGFVNFENLSSLTWSLIFGVTGIFFFANYLIIGTRQWGWLFPALIFIAISITIGLDNTPIGNVISGAPILAGVAVPFLVAYAYDPQNKKWAFIPAWIMLVLTGVVLSESFINGKFLATIILLGIGLPFLLIYLFDRTRKWALIPFMAISVVSFIPLMEEYLPQGSFEISLMAIFSLPFIAVYLYSRKNWWSIIPAGTFISIGLSLGVGRLGLNGSIVGAMIVFGLGATFGLLWLLRKDHQTDWAKYPAMVLLAASLLILVLGDLTKIYGPIILIGTGLLVVIYSIAHRKEATSEKKE